MAVYNVLHEKVKKERARTKKVNKSSEHVRKGISLFREKTRDKKGKLILYMKLCKLLAAA